MIRSVDFNKEISLLEEKASKGEATDNDIVKGLCLIGKVLRDVKSNQVTVMKAQGFLKDKEEKK